MQMIFAEISYVQKYRETVRMQTIILVCWVQGWSPSCWEDISLILWLILLVESVSAGKLSLQQSCP